MDPAGRTDRDILIGTGGALVFADDAGSLLRAGLRLENPLHLTPASLNSCLIINIFCMRWDCWLKIIRDCRGSLKETLKSLGRI